MALTPIVLPSARLASYAKPVAAAPSKIAAPSSSTQLAQFATQQLGGLTQTPNVAGAGIKAPQTDAGSGLLLPKTAVGNQLEQTKSNLAAGAKRVNQLYALRQQQKAVGQNLAQTRSSGFMVGRQASASNKNSIASIDSRLSRYGSGYLSNSAARQLTALNAAYHAATGGALSLTEGWRSLSRQQQLYALYRAGKGNLAARPGTSVHETGNAADLGGFGGQGSAGFNWLVQNAGKFGWSWAGRNFSQIEPWHWEYVGG